MDEDEDLYGDASSEEAKQNNDVSTIGWNSRAWEVVGAAAAHITALNVHLTHSTPPDDAEPASQPAYNGKAEADEPTVKCLPADFQLSPQLVMTLYVSVISWIYHLSQLALIAESDRGSSLSVVRRSAGLRLLEEEISEEDDQVYGQGGPTP